MSARAGRSRRGLPARAAGVATPADRHYRRSEMRPPRRRGVVSLVGRWTRALLVPALLAGAAAWVAAALAASPLFEIDRIDVRGTVRLSPGEVEALVADLRGRNLLTVDVEPYRRRVLDSRWVAGVSLARRLPTTLELEVTERVPLAIARIRQQLYLVDAGGVIIDSYGPQYREFDLPIVDGLAGGGRAGAPAIDPARLQTTARLLGALTEDPPLSARVSQIDAADPRDLVVLLDDDPARLHVGDEAFVARLRNYLELAPALREQLTVVDYVDLRFGERVFARSQGRLASVRRTSR